MFSSILHYGDNKNTEGACIKGPQSLRAISSFKIYRPMRAQRMVERRRCRFQKPRKLTSEVRATIIRYLKKDWSPQQITGRLRALGKADVCHETIYEMIRRDKASGGKLYQHCRFQLKHINHWLSRKGRKLPDGRKSITKRPLEADGKRFGDWEMDLIIEPRRSATLTIIERSCGKC